jgi:hypothetical protein
MSTQRKLVSILAPLYNDGEGFEYFYPDAGKLIQIEAGDWKGQFVVDAKPGKAYSTKIS